MCIYFICYIDKFQLFPSIPSIPSKISLKKKLIFTDKNSFFFINLRHLKFRKTL